MSEVSVRTPNRALELQSGKYFFTGGPISQYPGGPMGRWDDIPEHQVSKDGYKLKE
jgi:hypothetical protein